MSDGETIATSEGPVWVKQYDNGDVSFWTPPGSPQGDLVAEILLGRAAWKPKFRSWFAPPVHAEQLIEELRES